MQYLSGDDVAHVVVGAARITIAGFASVTGIGETPVFRKTLVAIASGHVALAHALAAEDVAALQGSRIRLHCTWNWLRRDVSVQCDIF